MTKVVTDYWIPVLLAIATGFGVIANLVLGNLYDRRGLPVVLVAVFLTALFSPLVFFGGFYGGSATPRRTRCLRRSWRKYSRKIGAARLSASITPDMV
jgi:hypothetical protein